MAAGNGFHPVRGIAAWFDQTLARANLLPALGMHIESAVKAVHWVVPPPASIEVTFPQAQWEALQALPNGSAYPAVFRLRAAAVDHGRVVTPEGGEKVFRFSMPTREAPALARALAWTGARAELKTIAAGVGMAFPAVALLGLLKNSAELLFS